MTPFHDPAPFYVECSIPEGLTLREWRKSRSVPHVSRWGRLKAWRRRYLDASLWGSR